MAIKRAQTSLEYLMIIAGAIAFVILVIVILRGVFSTGEAKTTTDVGTLDDNFLKSYIFYDDFDSFDATKNKWGQTDNYHPTFWSNGKLLIDQGAFILTRTVFSNFSISFKLSQIESGDGYVDTSSRAGLGIVFRFDGKKGYNISFEPIQNKTSLYNINGVLIAQSENKLINSMTKTGEVFILIKVYGKNVKIYVNEEKDLLIDAELPEPLIIAGTIGFFVTDIDKLLYIDDFKVWDESKKS